MTENLEVYRCNICGNIVEVVHEGIGELVCCGEPMELLEEKVEEEGMEKHLPVVEEVDEGVKVKVGEKEHPMEEKHYIEWIEVLTEDGAYRVFLEPGDKPEVVFDLNQDKITAVESTAVFTDYGKFRGVYIWEK